MIAWSKQCNRWAVAISANEIDAALRFVGDDACVLQRGSAHVIDFEITHRCPFQCGYCYLGDHRIRQELSQEDALDRLERLYHLGMRVLTVTGGEPFLRRSLLGQIGGCFGERVLLSCNTGVLEFEWDDVLARFDILRISCDNLLGVSAHRSGDGRALVRTLGRRRGPKPEVVLNTVVTQENLALLPRHYEAACDLGVRVAFLGLEHVGNGAHLTAAPALPRIENYSNNLLGGRGLGCLANRKCITLLPDGRYLRCILQRSHILNRLPRTRLASCGLHVVTE